MKLSKKQYKKTSIFQEVHGYPSSIMNDKILTIRYITDKYSATRNKKKIILKVSVEHKNRR